MQDRSYAIAIVLVLAICCLGMYVAVSGYLNSNPSAFTSLSTTPAIQATLVVVVINTETPAPTKPGATLAPPLTSAPVPSPLGAFQTITAATSVTVAPGTPTATPKAALTPTVPRPPSVPSPSAQSCSGFPFCPKPGPPNPEFGPGGVDCAPNYIWGRIIDVNGRGIPGMRIRFKGPLGDISTVESKGPPDPSPGAYNQLAPSGTFTLWLLDAGGGGASPRVQIAVQRYMGTGNCPTRMDFIAQR